MAKIKLKGHNINLTNIVIHKLNKSAGDKVSRLKLATDEITIGRSEVKFIADVRESLYKKSVPTHGVFRDDFLNNGFQKAILAYKNNEIDFMQFSKKSMSYYKRVIEASVPATGGFLVFSDFTMTDSNKDRYILILAIDNRQGYSLNEAALALDEILNLDLNKMDLASLLNMTRWDRSQTEEQDVKTYITFVRGKKKISDYYLNFIGCEDRTTASQSSRLLLDTINTYVQEKGIPQHTYKDVTSRILDYCQDCNKRKIEINLAQISRHFDDENPDDFLFYATSERFGNNEIIKYDSKILRTLKFIDYKSEDFELKFNKKMLGKSIRYNKSKNILTISDLPDDLKLLFTDK